VSALAGNRAAAQADNFALPDAADGLEPVAPSLPPALKFTDAKGRKLSLSDYKGHVLVVNLWATWCGPCDDELPTFATLAGQIQQFGGLVLPISIDVSGVQAVGPFYAQHAITNLPILLDPDGDSLDALDTNGVPVTIIINPEGMLVARLDGGANWNTPRVLAFLRSLAPASNGTKPTHISAL
jgi:thiol-disulfide isomerase/thioredoxin